MSINLRPWQDRAYKAWKDNGSCGIVEAVTGAGKTHVALYAIQEYLKEYPDGSVLIIVPSIQLQKQWEKKIEKFLDIPRNQIDKLGGGNVYNRKWRILITVINSLRNRAGFIRPYGLLIADECHHYGTENNSNALKRNRFFTKRMGLTATYERSDNGIKTYLDPFFKRNDKSICYSLLYREALAEDVISHFCVYFYGVKLDPELQDEYEKYNKYCKNHRQSLINEYGIPPEPFGEFMKAVTVLSKSGGPGSKYAGLYLGAFSKRRAILANSQSKLKAIDDLKDDIDEAERTIIFSQTKDAADNVVNLINKCTNKNAAVLEAGMNRWERDMVFADFEDGDTDVVAAPLLLDEGVDVPSADLAIILASNSSKRQMIQRMGRVIRKKDDGRKATIFVIYVEGTSEDPMSRAHEEFLGEIEDVADNCMLMESNGDVYEYINGKFIYTHNINYDEFEVDKDNDDDFTNNYSSYDDFVADIPF